PTPRELAKLDGAIAAAVGFGRARFAAVSSHGELVVGDLATGALIRSRVAPGATSALAADRDGRVVLAEDNRLLLWSPRSDSAVSAKPVSASSCGSGSACGDGNASASPCAPGSPCGDVDLVE